jgi:hypothetical protein
MSRISALVARRSKFPEHPASCRRGASRRTAENPRSPCHFPRSHASAAPWRSATPPRAPAPPEWARPSAQQAPGDSAAPAETPDCGPCAAPSPDASGPSVALPWCQATRSGTYSPATECRRSAVRNPHPPGTIRSARRAAHFSNNFGAKQRRRKGRRPDRARRENAGPSGGRCPRARPCRRGKPASKVPSMRRRIARLQNLAGGEPAAGLQRRPAASPGSPAPVRRRC